MFEATCYDTFSVHAAHIVGLFAYLCVEVVLIYPSSPTDGAFECVCLVLRSAVAWAPSTFAASMHSSNTRSIGAGKRARGRTEGRQVVLLVIIDGADAVDEVVSNVLCAQWATSGLFYGGRGKKKTFVTSILP